MLDFSTPAFSSESFRQLIGEEKSDEQKRGSGRFPIDYLPFELEIFRATG